MSRINKHNSTRILIEDFVRMKGLLAASLFGFTAAYTQSEKDSGIKKVITLLGELKTKVETETAQGEKDAEEYADWCIKTTAELKKDVEYGGQKVEELSAALEDGSARAAAAAADISTLSPQIGKLQDEQAKAAEVRSKEHADFVKEEAELTEADTMLQKAYAVLKRSLSLMQTGGSDDVQTIRNVVSALGVIIDSAWIDPESVNKIKVFLEAEDGLEFKQPQAVSSNYQSKSGGILGAIQGMQEKNSSVLSKLREEEMTARHKFEMLAQDLKNQENSVTDQIAALKETEAKATATAKQAESDLATTTETLNADKTELTETKGDCKAYAEEWAARKASATEEISVIQQAIEILSGKFGGGESFLQISSSTSEDNALAGKSMEAQDYERRSNAAMLLRHLSHEYNSFGLMQVAVAAQDDPFVKVRGMIKDMISKLEEEAQKEATAEAKCKADKAKGEKSLKIKKAQYDKLLSRSDAANAKFTKLGEEVKELGSQLKELAASVKEETNIRNKEKADNQAVIKDSAESIEALTKAIEVLSKFYGTAPALVQTQAGQPQTDTANVIMEILATSQEDFEKLKQNTESAETDAAEKYEKSMQEAEVTKAKKTAEMEGKTKEKATVKVQISQISEDLGEASKALEAASSFLKGVKEQCSNKAMSYEERKKRREAEIKGLEEALQILSPDEGEFLQTGFMSKKN